METRFLLPNRFKKIGLIALLPALILGVLSLFNKQLFEVNTTVFALTYMGVNFKNSYFTFVKSDIYVPLVEIFLLVSLVLTAFSKEKDEDEYVLKLRLESLVWATYINCGLLLFNFLFIQGFIFSIYMMIINLYSLLLLFIIRFNYQLYKTRKMAAYEK